MASPQNINATISYSKLTVFPILRNQKSTAFCAYLLIKKPDTN